MAIYKEDIVSIDLNAGTIHRSFMNHSIGTGDDDADHFGVLVFREKEPVDLTGVTVEGFFMPPQGDPIAITTGNIVSGNKAVVVLPQACYNYDGQFTLAIKLISTSQGITGTVRIVDGMVDNTHTGGAVAPTETIPTYQEILALYDDMEAAKDATEEFVADTRQEILALYDDIEAAKDATEEFVADTRSAMLTAEVDVSEYETRGKIINTYGQITTTALTIAHSMPIPVEEGKKYTLIAKATDQCAAICECSATGTNIHVVETFSETDEYEKHVYEAKKDGFIAVVYNYENVYILQQEDDIGEISKRKENLIDLTDVEIGKDWTGGTNTRRATLKINVEPNKNYYLEVPEGGNIWGVSAVQKKRNVSGVIASVTVEDGASAVINTRENTDLLIIQFAGTADIQSSDFEDYEIRLYKDKEPEEWTAMDTVSRSVFSLKKNLTNSEKFTIGKDWTGADNTKRATIIVPVKPDTLYTIEIPTKTNFWSVSLVQRKDKWNLPLDLKTVDTGTALTFITESTAYWLYVQINSNADITSSTLEGYNIYLYEGLNKKECADQTARNAAQGWKNKKIVWLGTSIPAAGKDGLDNRHAYPDMVGDILEAIVYNEAVGSSALHCKLPGNISESNPYGFMNNFEAVSRCLTNSLEEMEWIIEHYDDESVFTVNVPVSLSDSDKEFIRSCSWENKLGKYFTAAKFPDVWVFDHGHNDNPNETSEARYTARTTLEGTQSSGYYVGGEYVSSDQSSYIEFNVSDIEEVFLTGTNGGGYDTYDLFDGSGNLLKYHTNQTQRNVSDLLIDTSAAAKLRISNPNNLISTIEVKKYTYGSMYNSPYSFQGAADFVINKIKEYKPTARIIMIGEYENQKLPKVSYYQEQVSKRWEFPLYRQWENLGWSQQPIKVNGEYKTLLNIFIPDNLHPHTDTTGLALKMIAENIAAWMNTIRA